MKEHKVIQGSAQWYAARLGKPTASQFRRILTPAKGERSKQDRAYLYMLIAEKMLNRPLIKFPTTEYMEDGKANEPYAALEYQIQKDVVLEDIGFVTDDKERWGASPDRIFAANRKHIAEFKCPQFHSYLRALLEDEKEFIRQHKPQLMGQLFVGEFEKVMLIGYFEKQPFVVAEVGRDDVYIENLRVALRDFCEERDDKIKEAHKKGVLIVPQELQTPLEQHYADQMQADVVVME